MRESCQDRDAFPGDGILPDLPDSYRCAIRRARRIRMRHYKWLLEHPTAVKRLRQNPCVETSTPPNGP
jgi:hypothetical protein